MTLTRGVITALFLPIFAAATLGASVDTAIVARAGAGSGCAAPDAVTSFQQSDKDVWAYFLVSGAKSGDAGRIDWINPSNDIDKFSSFNPLPSDGTFCLTSGISTTDRRYILTPGRYVGAFLSNPQGFHLELVHISLKERIEQNVAAGV